MERLRFRSSTLLGLQAELHQLDLLDEARRRPVSTDAPAPRPRLRLPALPFRPRHAR